MPKKGRSSKPGRRRHALHFAQRATGELGRAVGLDVEQVPGAVRQVLEADDRPSGGAHYLALSPQGEARHALEIRPRLDRRDELGEGLLALSDADRVVEPGLQLQARVRAREPAADEQRQVGVGCLDPP
ncbi:MAG: hypothetical protein QF903_01960 [Planctomycetota bacterium]|jgi:hypothetical protein|nr:hypothetical protein [Planctomycetota bacterium]MDP6988229.1 hypothetical protein [Planctomycetota bacterium]